MEITRNLDQFKIKKARKDQEKIIFRERLASILGRTTKSIFFTTIIWTEDMLADSISVCQHYTTIQTRNWHFNEYRKKTLIPIEKAPD